MFVRLVLFTGLRLGELLGLRWEDIDFRAGILHVRRTLNRLNKMKRPLQPGEPTTEIVIQTPKSQNSIRAIPLLPAVLQELQGWQYVQQKDAELAGDQYNASGYIVTNPLGGMIEPRTFKDYYHQILQASGLCHFTFHALRHRFASRAMEQGMDPKTLSEIMGHYSVSFTLDTYAHVLDGHKQEAVALLGDLFTAQPQSAVYPLVVTTEDNGLLLFDLIDFPDIDAEASNMAEGIASIKEQMDLGENAYEFENRKSVVLVIGVNGVGKTTSVGKLAGQLKDQGKKVILAAADTFRAAAIEQLTEWAGRAGVELIAQQEGSDPAAVIYDAIAAAKSRNADVLICDTAGRLHNKKNLMEELKKINRIIDKEYPDAYRETLVVLDGTTGQNALAQAKQFMEVADITGIILTKLDGTAKGGIAVAIQSELGIPVKYVGIGEKIDDLQKFDANDFVNALFKRNEALTENE